MLNLIKTAVLGDTTRTNAEPNVSETDPFRPASDPAADGVPDHVEMDQIFGTLANKRRRYVLNSLSMTEETITMSDLAEQIAGWECGKDPDQLNSQERKRVYVSLYQCHLPKMADASAISYNKQRGKIEKGEQFDTFTRYLRSDE